MSNDNAALRWLRFTTDSLNALDEPADGRHVASALADDHVFDDRRRGGANFGRIDDADAITALFESNWGLTEGRPHWTISEVVATRGERCAAIVMQIDYGNGMIVKHIACWRLDTSLRRANRHVCFDTADLEAAIAELDRLYVEDP